MLTEEQVVAEYKELESPAEEYAKIFTSHLQRNLSSEGILLPFGVFFRVKSLDSILEKIQRKGLQLSSVRELSDLVGLRVVLLFSREVEAVRDFLRDTVTVHEEVDRGAEEPGYFGYHSLHMIVSPPGKWLESYGHHPREIFRSEIQIRTYSQDIWAESSYELQYKREASVPPQLRRPLHRVAAILEVVDLELERLMAARDAYRTSITLEDPAHPLDVDVLDLLLNDPRLEEHRNAQRGSDSEHLDDLLADLNQFGFTTVGAVQQLFDEHLEKAIAEDRDRADHTLKILDPEARPDLHARVRHGVLMGRIGIVRGVLRMAIGQGFTDYKSAQFQRRKEERAKMGGSEA